MNRHAFTVPAGVPDGAYQIEAGLQTPTGGHRLRALDTWGQPVGNNAVVDAVTVR